MPTFLATEWIAALADALADAPLPDHDHFTPFTLRQVVTAGPDRAEIDYQVTFSGYGIRVVSPAAGSDPPADLAFVCDYDTAAALNRGEFSAQEALESGRLEIRGRLDRITGARKMLVALGDATVELRATTTYDRPLA